MADKADRCSIHTRRVMKPTVACKLLAGCAKTGLVLSKVGVEQDIPLLLWTVRDLHMCALLFLRCNIFLPDLGTWMLLRLMYAD